MTTIKKITKRTSFTTILDILTNAEETGYALPEDMTYQDLVDFINHEIELLDNKAAASAKRAKDKKAAGDMLRDRIHGILSDTEFKTLAEIVADLNDPDVSPQMVTSRLTQLKELNLVEKDSMTVPATGEGGKSRRVVAYRKING